MVWYGGLWFSRFLAYSGVFTFKGVIDCSGNPNYPAGNCGDTYRVSVAGKIGGASGPSVEVNDLVMCILNGSPAGTHAVVGANWVITQANIDGAVTGPASSTAEAIALFNSTSGKVIKDSTKTIVTTLGADDTTVPTSKAVKDVTDAKIAKTTNITALNETGIADGEIAVFNLTNKDIRTSDKTIVTSLGADDTTVPTSKAVKNVTDVKVTGPSGATGDDIVIFNSTTGYLVKDSGTKIADLASTSDTRITAFGIQRNIDGGGFALKTGAGSGKTFSSNNPVNIASVAHGLSDGDQVLIANTSDAAALPNGLYSVTRVDADNFTVPFNGTGTGGTADWQLVVVGRFPVECKSSITGWELAGDISGALTLLIYYAATLTGTWAEITGGGIAIASGATASGTFGSPIALAQYSYLKYAISANAGLHTNLSVLLKGTKVV